MYDSSRRLMEIETQATATEVFMRNYNFLCHSMSQYKDSEASHSLYLGPVSYLGLHVYIIGASLKKPHISVVCEKCSTHLSQVCSSVQKWLWNHGLVQFERTAVPARIVPKVIGISLTERWHTALTGSLTIYWHHVHTYYRRSGKFRCLNNFVVETNRENLTREKWNYAAMISE